jgi:hypothetical protein
MCRGPELVNAPFAALRGRSRAAHESADWQARHLRSASVAAEDVERKAERRMAQHEM